MPPRKPTPESNLKRFWSKVSVSGLDVCWNWTRSRHEKGYGSIGFNGKVERAHRVAWILTRGYIPDGLHVLHTCDNPSCCNPLHLWVGTNKDNVMDKVTKGRSPDKRGVKHPSVKLSEEDVVEIRRLRELGHTYQSIADTFAVTLQNVWRIVKKQTWSHI